MAAADEAALDTLDRTRCAPRAVTEVRHKQGELRANWATVCASFIGIACGVAGLPFYAIGSFIAPLEQALGWSRVLTASGMIALAAGLVLGSPIAGRWCDRTSATLVVTISTLLVVAGFAGLAAFGDRPLPFFLCYAAIGFFGAGTGPVVYTRVIGRMFDRQRGLAIGIVLTGTGFAGIITPLMVHQIVDLADWRAAWLGLGALALLPLPLVLLGLRRGAASMEISAVAAEAGSGPDLRMALHMRQFWTLALSVMLFGTFMAGLAIHVIPLLTDHGLSSAQAARTAALIGLSVIVSRLVVGVLIDRYFGPYVGFGIFAFAAAGCGLFALGGSPVLLAVALGAALGAEIDLVAYLVTRYFGLRSYGAIYGTIYAVYMTGGAISPTLIGLMYETAGSYGSALAGSTAALVIVALLFLTMGPYPGRFEGRAS